MKERLDQVKRACGTMYASMNFANIDERKLQKFVKKFLVDEKHKVLYCYIAKSGSVAVLLFNTLIHILLNQ